MPFTKPRLAIGVLVIGTCALPCHSRVVPGDLRVRDYNGYQGYPNMDWNPYSYNMRNYQPSSNPYQQASGYTGSGSPFVNSYQAVDNTGSTPTTDKAVDMTGNSLGTQIRQGSFPLSRLLISPSSQTTQTTPTVYPQQADVSSMNYNPQSYNYNSYPGQSGLSRATNTADPNQASTTLTQDTEPKNSTEYSGFVNPQTVDGRLRKVTYGTDQDGNIVPESSVTYAQPSN